MSAGRDNAVLVTGGSGYLAGWMIVALLRRGLLVRATLRDLDRGAAVREVLRWHAPVERLTFHAADLFADRGWDAAADGVGRVLHVASPMPVREYRNSDLVGAARGGTRRVLAAARRAEVAHVVLISSITAAMVFGGTPAITDETCWTDVTDRRVSRYARSKTLAERDAWAFAAAADGAPTLTTILPGFLEGPVLGPAVSGSLEIVARMLRGEARRLPHAGLAVVDTRDVVELSLAALTHPRAVGRRILAASDPLWLRDIAAILKEHFGARANRVSTRTAPEMLVRLGALFSADLHALLPDLGRLRRFDSSLAETLLGRALRPSSQAIVAAAQDLLALEERASDPRFTGAGRAPIVGP